MALFAQRAAMLAAFGWCCVTVAAWIFQEQLLFPGAWMLPDGPDEQARRQAMVRGRGIREVKLTAENGDSVLAWHWRASGARALLVAPGNAQPLDSVVTLANSANQLGWDLFVVSWRGYPGSEGEASAAAFVEDLDLLWAEAERVVGDGPIALHGRSIGGGVVGELLWRRDPACVVLESTFTSLDDIAARQQPLLPVRLLLRHHLRVRDTLSAVAPAPTLIMHSYDDDLIPVAHAQLNAGTAPHAQLSLTRGIGHNVSTLSDPAVRGAWEAFLDACAERVRSTGDVRDENPP